MLTKWKLLALASILAAGCQDQLPTGVGADGAVALRVTASVVGTPIATLVVTVSASDISVPLVFNLTVAKRTYVPPARHWVSNQTSAVLPPMGMRVRLKAGVDISTYPADVQVILTALKRYGMMLADNGSAFFVSGAPDPRWNEADINLMKRLHGSDFEVVQMVGLVAGP